MDEFRLLKLPIGADHIQNRIDHFCEELFPTLTPEQLEQVLECSHNYLLKHIEILENNGQDSFFACLALARLGEAKYWVYQLWD